jgi:hypothetical protein
MEHGNFGYTDEMTGAGWGQGKMAKYPNAAPGSDENWLDRIARHWHQYDPGVVPNLLNTGAGSPTGILVYEGDLLPAIFRNQLIHCEPGSNVVRAYTLTNDGAGYKAGIVNIMKSKDSWFRPSDVCVAPDGSLFVADWFDPGVGGHQMGDNDPNTAGGRLYRVAPTGSTAVAPKLDLSSAAGATAALASPNLATRYLAWTKLHELGAQAEGELVKMWKGSNPAPARARPLAAEQAAGEGRRLHRRAAAKDADSDIRITALRAASEIKLDIIPLVKRPGEGPLAPGAARMRPAPAPFGLGRRRRPVVRAGARPRWQGPLVPRGPRHRRRQERGCLLQRLAGQGRGCLGHPGRQGHRLALALQ